MQSKEVFLFRENSDRDNLKRGFKPVENKKNGKISSSPVEGEYKIGEHGHI